MELLLETPLEIDVRSQAETEPRPAKSEKKPERRRKRVRIKTKEKCPKCGKSFKFSENFGLICRRCLTKPNRYYIYLSWQGRKLKIYSFKDGQPLSSWELARRACEIITHEIEKGVFDPSRWVKSDIKNFLFSTRLKEYLEEINPHLKPSSWKVKKIWLEKALKVISDMDVREIRAYHINSFLQALLKEGKSPKTCKNALGELSAFLNYLKRLEYLEKVPSFPKVKVPDPVIRWLDAETQQKILFAIPSEHRDIFFFLFVYGVRPSEARALQWDCVDFKEKIIIIRRNFSENKLVNIPKEGDWKTLPMPAPIEEMLLRRAKNKQSPFVFCHSEGTQGKFWYHYGDKQLRKIFKKACDSIGVKGITLYQAVRHSFAMQELNAGRSYEAVARALGHKHTTTTKRYGKLQTETVRPLLEERSAKIISLEKARRKRTRRKKAGSDS